MGFPICPDIVINSGQKQARHFAAVHVKYARKYYFNQRVALTRKNLLVAVVP
jgi:hypothetical protein